MKKSLLFIPFVALALSVVSLTATKATINTEAAYERKTVFEDKFDGAYLNDNWVASEEGVSFNTKYSSMRFSPNSYNWEASVNLNRKFTGGFKINLDVVGHTLGQWFSLGLGNEDSGSAFTSMSGGLVFYNDNKIGVLDSSGGMLEPISDVFSPSLFGNINEVRRTATITIQKIDENLTKMQCEIFEKGVSLGTAFTTPYEYNHSLDGYIGFNVNFKEVEIFSIEVLDLNDNQLYYDDFSSSSVLYPTSGSSSSEWVSTVLDESELKVGFVKSLFLSEIDSSVTYANPLPRIENKDIDLGYVIKSEIEYSPMDYDIESGFEVAKNSLDDSFHFFGIRRLVIGYALIHYSSESEQVDKIDTFNEGENMTVEMSLSIYQNGEIKFACGELNFSTKIENYEGFVGLFTTNVLKNRTSGSGAFFNDFSITKTNYNKRDASDVYMNFNGVKDTYYEDVDIHDYSYFISRQEWNIGSNVSTSRYRVTDEGNGKLVFTAANNKSYFGPKKLYKDFLVKFDVEVTSASVPKGSILGLEFGNSRAGLIYENTKALGIGYYMDENGVYRTVPALTNSVQFAPGAEEYFYDDAGEIANIYNTTKKFTLMYISRNGIVSLYYLLDGQDESNLQKVRTSVMCKEGGSTDGYLAVFGVNGISFTIDNLSVINLDLDAPSAEYKGTSNYQEVTRLDFAKSSDTKGATIQGADYSNGKMRISSNGEIKSSKLVNNFNLRLGVKDIEDTLTISQDKLNIKIVNHDEKYIEIDDGVNNQKHQFKSNFDFRNSIFEFEKIDTTLNIRYVEGNTSLSLFVENVLSFDISSTADSLLSIKSFDGFVDLTSFTFVNYNIHTTITARNYDPASDDLNPWPYRPTQGESTSSGGCSGNVSATSLVIFSIAFVSLLVLVSIRRRIRK